MSPQETGEASRGTPVQLGKYPWAGTGLMNQKNSLGTLEWRADAEFRNPASRRGRTTQEFLTAEAKSRWSWNSRWAVGKTHDGKRGLHARRDNTDAVPDAICPVHQARASG